MKLFVLQSGIYSDYGVDGIFSSMENAELYKAHLDDPHKAWIEEWELDPGIEGMRAGLTLYRVNIMKGSTAVAIEPLPGGEFAGVHSSIYEVWTKDEQTALKIASDRHYQRLEEERQTR